MTQSSKTALITIRPMQYRDLEVVERLHLEEMEVDRFSYSIAPDKPLKPLSLQPWNQVLSLLNLTLNPLQHRFCIFLAEQEHKIRGIIRVAPFNRTRSTWRVDRVLVDRVVVDSINAETPDSPTEPTPFAANIGSQLLRHCFEKIWEARTWLLEVNIQDKDALALYRQNGFQPLAHMTYWAIAPETLQELVDREPDLPNLLPVSNADAQLLYQLDTTSMPPLVRQVFDRHILDFKTSLVSSLLGGLKNWLSQTEAVSAYVFESQRKAAIGYFQIRLSRDGAQPHQAQLTVHPAYTWLYPELLAQMARITQALPAQSLHLASSDYQPEREEYLERVGATRIAHTLMMSRSVWHKVKEAKPVALEGLQLSEVLQGLKPSRKPVPSRVELRSEVISSPVEPTDPANPDSTGRSNRLTNLSRPNDFSEPPQAGC
jgi:hypothetical protein